MAESNHKRKCLPDNPIIMRKAMSSFCTLALTAAALIAATGQTNTVPTIPNPAVPMRSDVIGITLEPERTIYREGEAVRLQIALTNRSSSTIAVPTMEPWWIVSLVVRDRDGRSVKSKGVFPTAVDISAYRIEPGQSQTLYARMGDRIWHDISYWGYDHLSPGTYSITAIPISGGQFLDSKGNGQQFGMSREEGHANAIQIVVLPSS